MRKIPSIKTFKACFKFDPAKTLHIGVERESFIADASGHPVPKAADVLRTWWLHKGASHGPWAEEEIPPADPKRQIGFELSACQLERRVGPCRIERLPSHLKRIDRIMTDLMDWHGLSASHEEVGAADMSLRVYPDPDGRYRAITRNMDRNRLLAACRIIGTHVHIGMPDHDTALKVYNHAIEHTDHLSALGDNSKGQRLAIYREVTPGCHPPRFRGWNHFHEYALENECAADPRRCWTLIRISVHGTIEFRMFGATDDVAKVVSWARTCHDLCKEAM